MSQVIVDAFVSTLGHAVEKCLSDINWEFVIRQLHELLARKDLKRLCQYCEDKNSFFRREEDYRLYEDCEYSFVRPQDKEGELSDSSNDEGPLVDNNQMQHDYYLAYKQLSAYKHWIKLLPAQALHNKFHLL